MKVGFAGGSGHRPLSGRLGPQDGHIDVSVMEPPWHHSSHSTMSLPAGICPLLFTPALQTSWSDPLLLTGEQSLDLHLTYIIMQTRTLMSLSFLCILLYLKMSQFLILFSLRNNWSQWQFFCAISHSCKLTVYHYAYDTSPTSYFTKLIHRPCSFMVCILLTLTRFHRYLLYACSFAFFIAGDLWPFQLRQDAGKIGNWIGEH
jgi:hypothetical protein